MASTQIDIKDYSYFADNQWRHAKDDHFFEVHEPYSGKLFARLQRALARMRVPVDAASRAFTGWSETHQLRRPACS
jgi:aldehyde dehydrogenase (NAD+)